ncbi:HAMP domain-containing protein, partial [Actinoplanes philippinensis]|uniref:HAMP domain-containing protein n=1 Tax=Actinoplanes philippinensis TaxID=35752 RepID=UPI0033F4C6B5
MARPRSSLVLRLLAVSAVVSMLSVAATAWLTVRATTSAIRQQPGRVLVDDARIYDTLIGYAATHRDWTGAGPLVESLAANTGRRIVITDRDRRTLLASPAATDAGPLPAEASAPLDALAVDALVSPGGVDQRAVGPFLLPDTERAALGTLAADALSCLRGHPATPAATARAVPAAAQAEIVYRPSGRPDVRTSDGEPGICAGQLRALAEPTATEEAALDRLRTLTNACLTRQGMAAVAITLDGGWVTTRSDSRSAEYGRSVESCLAGAKREQLTGYVAPAAWLFLLDADATRDTRHFDLSPAGRARIAGVTALVLLAAIGVTVLVGRRLVRPLHELTAAAGRMRAGEVTTRVEVRGHDEIARLGSAFNAMAEQRRHVEELRRAMVNDIAHEMRSPLTNIRGWLEAADEGVVPLDAGLVSSLLEEAVLLQHVIDDLRDLAAADAGELRLTLRTVDIGELLHAAVSGVAPGRVTLLVSADGAGLCTADPIRLRQAVGNLVGNAIR